MKTKIFFLITTILSLNIYSQISFKEGYLINNKNQKIKCLIKNFDWRNNPTEFEYKLSENEEPIKATIKSIKEFGVINYSKYIRYNVNIDRSSMNANKLSEYENPIFKKEVLFLKALIEGKANLYEYIDGNLRRYFYSKKNMEIEQLIYKIYKTDKSKIRVNNKFRNQLFNNLKSPNFKLSIFKKLEYKKNDLLQFFFIFEL